MLAKNKDYKAYVNSLKGYKVDTIFKSEKPCTYEFNSVSREHDIPIFCLKVELQNPASSYLMSLQFKDSLLLKVKSLTLQNIDIDYLKKFQADLMKKQFVRDKKAEAFEAGLVRASSAHGRVSSPKNFWYKKGKTSVVLTLNDYTFSIEIF